MSGARFVFAQIGGRVFLEVMWRTFDRAWWRSMLCGSAQHKRAKLAATACYLVNQDRLCDELVKTYDSLTQSCKETHGPPCESSPGSQPD